MGATVEVMVVSGVEGPSLYINDRRVAGPKPWGGGKTVYQWKCEIDQIRFALPERTAQGRA